MCGRTGGIHEIKVQIITFADYFIDSALDFIFTN